MEKYSCYVPVAVRTTWLSSFPTTFSRGCVMRGEGRCCLLSFSSWTLPFPYSLVRAEAGFLDLALSPSLPSQKSMGEGLWGRGMTHLGWGSNRENVSVAVSKSQEQGCPGSRLCPLGSGPRRAPLSTMREMLIWVEEVFFFFGQDRRRQGISGSRLGLFCLEILFYSLVDQGSQNFIWDEKKVPEGF